LISFGAYRNRAAEFLHRRMSGVARFAGERSDAGSHRYHRSAKNMKQAFLSSILPGGV
jgi:hypothetical protein